MGKIKPMERDGGPTPREIFRYLDQYVIGQDRAKRTLAVAAYNHYKRVRSQSAPGVVEGPPEAPLRKANVLLIGPSGTGKTHLARHLARVLEAPFAVVDATEYTEAGYYGKDVEVMLGELLFAADLDAETAQEGIVFVDEIDKIARRNHGERTGAGSRDIGGEGVQQGMLKLLEGTKVFVPYNLTQHWSKHDFVQMDTTNILFICAGTFTDLKRGRSRRGLGFNSVQEPDGDRQPLHQRVTVEDLIEYGMIAEFLGRLPVITELHDLSEDHLVRIATEPPDSILKEYQRLFALDGVRLTLTAGAIREVARFARRRKLGARSLRAMFEEVMADYLFEAPERSGEELVLTEADVQAKLG